jgi:hypothetical protein
VRKWRKRTTTADTPMAPKALKSTVLSLALLYPSRFDESVVEHDGELGLGLAPFAWWHFPCLRNLAQDEIEQFDRSLIGWKMVSHARRAAVWRSRIRWRSWCK